MDLGPRASRSAMLPTTTSRPRMATAAATLAAIAIGALALAALVLAFYVAIPIALFRMALELTPRRAA